MNLQPGPDGAPFEVFFDGPSSAAPSATYTLDRLLKKDNHSDVFSLRRHPLGSRDPNPTGRTLEARRFIIDGSDGLPSRALQYRFRSAKRLASRQLRTSIPKSDHVLHVVYMGEEKLPGPKHRLESPEPQRWGSFGAPTELEKSQKIEVKELKRQIRVAKERADRKFEEYKKYPIDWSSKDYKAALARKQSISATHDVRLMELEVIKKEYSSALWRHLCSLVSRKGTDSIASEDYELEQLVEAAEEYSHELGDSDEETEYDGVGALFSSHD